MPHGWVQLRQGNSTFEFVWSFFLKTLTAALWSALWVGSSYEAEWCRTKQKPRSAWVGVGEDVHTVVAWPAVLCAACSDQHLLNRDVMLAFLRNIMVYSLTITTKGLLESTNDIFFPNIGFADIFLHRGGCILVTQNHYVHRVGTTDTEYAMLWEAIPSFQWHTQWGRGHGLCLSSNNGCRFYTIAMMYHWSLRGFNVCCHHNDQPFCIAPEGKPN